MHADSQTTLAFSGFAALQVGWVSASVHGAGEAASLALTFPTVALGVYVCATFWPVARSAIARLLCGDELVPEDRIGLGIWISFIGAIGDNLYWGCAWHANLTGSELWFPLFQLGCFPNVVFRQGCGILASYHHIRAAEDMSQRATDASRVWQVLLLSSLAGLVYAVVMFLLK